MKINLTQPQRLITAFLYLFILFFIFNQIGGNLPDLVWNSGKDSSIWFYSGIFMVILGSYIVEPFFSKPTDVIANTTAIIVALLGLEFKDNLIGYTFIFYFSIFLLLTAIVSILLKDLKRNFFNKLSAFCYFVSTHLGNSKVVFSIIYLSSAYSYFANPEKMISFISILAFWICLTFFDLIGLFVREISSFVKFMKQVKKDGDLGTAIGCDNPFLYKIEIDFTKQKSGNSDFGSLVAIELNDGVASIGVILNSSHLLLKKRLNVYLLTDESGSQIRIKTHDFSDYEQSPQSLFTVNRVFSLNLVDLPQTVQEKIKNNLLYKNRKEFVGFVAAGSNIGTINFSILRDIAKGAIKIQEGTVLKTDVYGKEVLYQVINGNTKEQKLENHDSIGLLIGIARKLGRYDEVNQEIDSVSWMPNIYAPLFLLTESASSKRVDGDSIIGKLPNTDLGIAVKDWNAVITHNTAILGILGIGKSCLTFEIIKKIIDNTDAKIVCIDITNEYKKELPSYVDSKIIANELSDEALADLKNNNRDGNETNPTTWGNEKYYADRLKIEFKLFDEDSEKRILLLNPDWHSVSKAGAPYKITHKADLTLAEKTRIISERLFVRAKETWEANTGSINMKAHILLVFEEAHSLVPEWNSTSNPSDQSASNGTAKVILQGRKFGLGSLVVTQRTANVSKSILNQCNTIFALRVFDDTGKGFLENYIGKDYSDTLSNLEERHAVAIGKGLMLKQPVIIQLNDKKDVIKKD